MYIDTHAHLLSHFYPDSIKEVLSNCKKHSIGKILNIGTEKEEFPEVLSLSKKYSDLLLPSLGFHPDTATAKDLTMLMHDISYLASLANETPLLSIGECGLDYKDLEQKNIDSKGEPLKEKQKKLLEWQLELALQYSLPVIIHCREAMHDLLPILSNYKKRYREFNAIIHSLDTTIEQAGELIHTGFFVSFNGIVTFKNAASIQNLAVSLPIDRIVLETDSPFLSPTPLRGTKNEPANIIHTYGYFAALREMPIESIQKQMQKNAVQIWGEAMQTENI